MLKAESIHLRRQRDAAGQVTGGFSTADAGENGAVVLLARAPAEGNGAFIAKGTTSIQCEKSKDMTGLTGKDFDGARAKLLSLPKGTISCLSLETRKIENVNYQFADGMIRLQNESYALNSAKLEILTLHEGASTLSYTLVSRDDRTVMIMLDAHGQLTSIDVTGKGSALYACDRELNDKGA
jgi:hypothetical protein